MQIVEIGLYCASLQYINALNWRYQRIVGCGSHGEHKAYSEAWAYITGISKRSQTESRNRVRGQGNEAPLKVKAFWILNVQQSGKICPHFCILQILYF